MRRNVLDDTQCEVTALSGSNWSSLNHLTIELLLAGMDSIEQKENSGSKRLKRIEKQLSLALFLKN